jgi:AcrR family transcriptional regulator
MPSHRAKVQSRNPDQTRKRLIEAAQKEFNTKGFLGTDTNRIARRAGFAPQTFYRHFDDKIAIFIAVYDEWWRAEAGALGDIMSRRTGRLDARKVAEIAIEFHTRWKIFRRSLRHLAIEEPRVRAARTAARLAQIRRLEANAPRKRKLEEMVMALLAAERLCDAFADGELADLGLSRGARLGAIIRSIVVLTGRGAKHSSTSRTLESMRSSSVNSVR